MARASIVPAAATARRDQIQAELRDLVQVAHTHQETCRAGGCPGPAWRPIARMRPEHMRALLAEAIAHMAQD